MGKTIQCRIRARLENVKELKTNHPNHSFSLKLKCTGCGEVSEKWHDVTESEKFPGKTGRSENNYIAKCKMCGRENCLDIVPGSNGKPNCCIVLSNSFFWLSCTIVVQLKFGITAFHIGKFKYQLHFKKLLKHQH